MDYNHVNMLGTKALRRCMDIFRETMSVKDVKNEMSIKRERTFVRM